MTIEDQMRSDAQRATPDQLERLRKMAREMRDLDREIEDAVATVKQKREQRVAYERDKLPALFAQAGVTRIDLAPEGNHPGYEVVMKDYYRASIGAEWAPERQAAAFARLEKMKLGDIIKNTMEIEFGRGENKLFKRVVAALKKLKVPYSVRRGVSWNTLTAAVKERYQAGRPLSDQDLETLGASVGQIVRLNPKKEKQTS